MSKVSVFILDFEKYNLEQVVSWLCSRVDESKLTNKQRIFSQFIRYFVLSKRFSILEPVFSSENGKPYLCNSDIHFNISHTDSKVIIAVANEYIGIDAEKISRSRKVLKIAKRYFKHGEFLSLEKSDDLYRDFYTLWTLKESQVKRSSLGIAKGLDTATFKVVNNDWISENYPNDFITFYYDELVISVCSNNIRNEAYSLFEIVDFEFKEIKKIKGGAMALHGKKNIMDDFDFFEESLPKIRIPVGSQDPLQTYQEIKDELMLDGNSKQNLATFCQTQVDDFSHKLMDDCLDKNMIDKDEYPQTAELESRCVNILANLCNSSAESAIGCSTTGSSEAAMLGGMAMKWRWRDKMKAQGKDCSKPNLVTGPVQVCWHKFAKYWDIELREIPMSQESLIMTPEAVIDRCDENTIGVVPTLGVTFTGQYEPVEEVCKALDMFEQQTGIDIPVHVDGASGGFLAPFIDPELKWDFRLPRVKSINASGHKFGLSPLGVGWVIWSDKKYLPDDLIFNVNYLGGDMPTFALNFSRPGGQIVAQYYNFVRLGFEGYRKVHQVSYDVTKYIAGQLDDMGIFEIIHSGQGGIPAVSWSLKSNKEYSLFDLSEKIRAKGWQIAAYSMPKDRQDLVVMRVLVRRGFTFDLAQLMIRDLKKAIQSLENKESNNRPSFSH